MQKLTFLSSIACALLSLTAFADGEYTGPANPPIPADSAPVDTSYAKCLKDTQDVTAWPAEQTAQAAHALCTLRQAHADAQTRVLADLAKLVATFRDYTNHDHAQNLPITIKAVQDGVKNCLDARASQEYCHNIACNSEPEEDATFCENQGSALVESIVGPAN